MIASGLVAKDKAIRAAENVLSYIDVKNGETVLVVRDNLVSPDITGTILGRAIELGADVTYLEHTWPDSPYAPISPPVVQAMKAADVVIANGKHTFVAMNRGALLARMGNGCRAVEVDAITMEEFTADSFLVPPDTLEKMVEDVVSAMKGPPYKVKVEAANGTSFNTVYYQVRPAPNFYRKQPGFAGLWPHGDIYMFNPVEEESNGRLVFDQVMIPNPYSHMGRADEPVVFTVERGWVTRVEGGDHAKQIAELYAKFKGDNYFDEVAVGMNPFIPPNHSNYHVIFRRAGNVRCAFGNAPWGKIRSPHHCDHTIDVATVIVNGRTIVENGEATIIKELGYSKEELLR